MKIAQMIETMGMGGAENLAVNIANNLADRGFDSHLIVITEPGPLSTRLQSNVTCHYLNFHRSSIRNPLAFLTSLRRGRRLINDLVVSNQIDVVQTHLPGANFWGLSLARDQACAVFPTIHNNEEFNYGDVDNAALVFLRKAAYRQMLKSCQGMVAVSEEVRSSMYSNLGLPASTDGRISVVTNAVPIPETIANSERIAIRDQLGIAPDEIFILAAGRFCEQKNFGDLLPVAKHLRASQLPFRLVVAGDGEQRQDLQHQAAEVDLSNYLIMPGNVTNLSQVMLAADIFVMTSLWEGLPLVLLEAMAASLPVTAYSIAGVAEVLEEDRSGITVPVSQWSELAAAIKRLIVDSNERRELGASARSRIEKSYSFDALVDELVHLYSTDKGSS